MSGNQTQFVAAPYSGAPPGLEEATNAEPMDTVAEKIRLLGVDGTEEIIKAVREAFLTEVDAKVAAKADELWRRGQQAILKMEEKHKEKTRILAEEVEKMIERQKSLEVENNKLKEVITTLHSRFHLLGAVFGGKGGVAANPEPAPTADTGASMLQEVASPSYPSTNGTPAQEVSASTGEAPLPTVPPFPFGAAVAAPLPVPPMPAAVVPAAPTSGSAAPLSLADALGSPAPPRQLSLVQSLTPTPAAEGTTSQFAAIAPFPVAPQPAAPAVREFCFTIRKADGADLGLNVSHHEKEQVLTIEGVRAEGAVEAWNRQCLTGTAKDKAVAIGDRIIQVNTVRYDPSKMLEECRDKQLLKLTILRGGPALTSPPNSPMQNASEASPTPSPSPTILRAEASVFVPSIPATARAASKEASPCTSPDAQDSELAREHQVAWLLDNKGMAAEKKSQDTDVNQRV